MSTSTQNPSVLTVLLHVALTFITGGVWLVILVIWHLLKKK